jgi:hypothetical protein
MEVEEIIIEHNHFLSDYGYKLDRKSFQYFKNFALGKKIVFFHHSQDENLSFEYNLGIRFDHVEFIVHQFLPSLGDYQERSITLVESLNGISPSFDKKQLLSNESQVLNAIHESERHLIAEGFPWLEKYSSGPRLERYFNEYPDISIASQNFTYRSARGVILCKLFNPDQFEEVKTNYLAMLNEKQVTPFTLACFLNLLNYLKNL